PELSDAQTSALRSIHTSFVDHQVTLLRGVTSSGKTEIFLHLMDFVLKKGNQVLMLVPEIALTTQLTRRVQRVFGSRVVIYHSRFSDAERVEIWNRLLHTSEPLIVIGARSAVFLPFAHLGLVIVDEEHESSYKQYDPAPRYNARDVAIVLAGMHGAKTLLASATPTIETYSKARGGRFGLVELTERYGNVVMPEIVVRDLSVARKKLELRGSLTKETVNDAARAIERGEQVIFFHNRRGFAPIARCKSCEYIPKCRDCDVSLTYHKGINRLVCHYCGAEYPMPDVCPVCKEPSIEIVGYGTERIEDDVDVFFPNARVLRMDLDTTRNKDDYSSIIDRFSEHKADILIGTQMVTKGLDFGDVSTVAVLSADQIFNYPDFRSTERAFNMLEQVSGRAGRRSTAGRVIVQTRQPDHPVIKFLQDHDYEGFYNHELEERKQFGYPPFTKLIYIFVRHKNAGTALESAEMLGKRLKGLLGNRVFGPHEPGIARIKNIFIQRLMVKIE
ncbi:MAG: primosomal protein N', partial [Muribaculaceae bacterium]|nr:primosomal protein N' [Muribaculaceae bacterium]